MAQAADFGVGCLLQSRGRSHDSAAGYRHWPGSLAMTARRHEPEGHFTTHLIYAVTSASLIFVLFGMRSRLRRRSVPPGIAYGAVTLFALMAITLTGHLGGILSGVEMP